MKLDLSSVTPQGFAINNIPWRLIGGIATALALAWLAHSRAYWKTSYETLHAQAEAVVISIKTASGNDYVNWDIAAAQVLTLGDDKRKWQHTSETQSAEIQTLNDETQRLRAESEQMRKAVAAAQAKRASALKKLEDIKTTPAERKDCEAMLKEANDALDTAYQAGV